MKSPPNSVRPKVILSTQTLQTRGPYSRMFQIFQVLQRREYPNRHRLSAMLEMDVKTVQRDLNFMRDRLGLPIEYDREKGGYYFTKPIQSFPILEISEEELISVFVAQKALVQFKGTPFEQPLKSAFNKLTSGMEGKIAIMWEDLETFIEFKSPDAFPPEAKTFQVVSEAVRRNKVLEFEYKKTGSMEFKLRHVEPYQLVCYRNQWYCFAHDIAQNAIRTFVLSRMQRAVLGVDEFVRPESFSIKDYLKNSFGVFSGSTKNQRDAGPNKLHHVVLRFDCQTAQLIRERVWHASQSIQELAGGELELSLSVNSLFELEAWVLSWGDHIQVLQPKELIHRVAEIAGNLLAKHRPRK